MIKKKSYHLFYIMKDPNETFRNYVKRFNVEKVKIVGCDDTIASATSRNGLLVRPPTVWGIDYGSGLNHGRLIFFDREVRTLG